MYTKYSLLSMICLCTSVILHLFSVAHAEVHHQHTTYPSLYPTVITNWYLYGQESTPTDLVDDNLIRPQILPNTSTITVDVNMFMTSGGGRFAVGRQFELINRFFTADASLFELNKSYTKSEIAKVLGYGPQDFYGWNMNQAQFQDNTDDYLERFYVYGAMTFKISDSAIFIVPGNGERRIENYWIEPLPENFDFDGGDISSTFNGFANPAIDPSRLGRKVQINFTDNLTPSVYDGDDYLSDLLLMNTWKIMDPVSASLEIVDRGPDLLNNLWNSGATKFLDGGKPILYGTLGNDALSPENIQDIFDDFASYIGGYPIIRDNIENGVILVSGEGNDILTGGIHDDKLMGGEGEDAAVFSSLCAEYEFTHRDDDSWTIIHRYGSQEDGTDTLHDIEQLQFSDTRVTLPGDGDAASLCTGQDIAFVIDVTSSMRDDIAAVKSEANNIINAIFSEENSMVNSRIAIVSYRDPGEVSTLLSFTEQVDPEERKAAAINSINSILVSGGGDDPEGVYSGLLHALNGSSGAWRETAVVRRLILFGDAPPKDYELADTVNALARDVNADIGPIPTARGANTGTVPVEIFTVAVGSDAETRTAFETIAKENSGRFFTAGTAGDVVNAILDAVSAPPVTGPNAINGTDGDDVLYGTENADEIRGLNGNDQIQGEGGSDILWGNEGNDTMWGWTGDDQLNGGPGNDLLGGDEGNDRMAGEEGDDTLWGWTGDDRLDGGPGNDLMGGDEGNDSYIYRPLDGHDTIADLLGNNRLVLGETIAEKQVRIGYSPKSDTDYVIFFDGAEGSITLLGQVTATETGLSEILFPDGTVWNRNAINARVEGTSPDVPNPPLERSKLYLPLIHRGN